MFKKTVLSAMSAIAIVGSVAAIASPASAGGYYPSTYYGNYQSSPRNDYWQEHVAWCFDHYRTYREDDNTFLSLQGPRKLCLSPYWRG